MPVCANANMISNQTLNLSRLRSLGFSLSASSTDVLAVLVVLGFERLSSVLSLPVESNERSLLAILDGMAGLLGFGAKYEDVGGGGGLDGGGLKPDGGILGDRDIADRGGSTSLSTVLFAPGAALALASDILTCMGVCCAGGPSMLSSGKEIYDFLPSARGSDDSE